MTATSFVVEFSIVIKKNGIRKKKSSSSSSSSHPHSRLKHPFGISAAGVKFKRLQLITSTGARELYA
jgi:hypothetical protein